LGDARDRKADELLRTMQMMNLPAIPSAQLVELALSIASFHPAGQSTIAFMSH